jgi:hypothetical protein
MDTGHPDVCLDRRARKISVAHRNCIADFRTLTGRPVIPGRNCPVMAAVLMQATRLLALEYETSNGPGLLGHGHDVLSKRYV